VDLDPQASLTLASVGDCSGHNLAQVMGGAHPGSLTLTQIIKPLADRLFIAPSDIALSVSENELGECNELSFKPTKLKRISKRRVNES
jgi:cellulose biosynthesis protein BcsQ